MSVRPTWTVFCNAQIPRSRCDYWAGEEDTKKEALAEARRRGWKRKRVQNGTMWDFCPACAKEYEAQQRREGEGDT